MNFDRLARIALLLVLSFFACATPENLQGTHIGHSSDGVPIAYDRHGSGDLTVLFVHGWSCDRTYWRNQIAAFSSDYQVVVMDLAGHGGSGLGRTRYTMKAFAQDVEAVVNQIAAQQVILVGHSMGGAVIAEAARLLPDQVVALVGIDTLQNVANSIRPEELEEMARPLEEDFVPRTKALVSTMFAPSTDQQLAEWIRDDMAAAPEAVALSAFREYIGQYVTGEAARVFQGVTTPVYCLNTRSFPTATDSNRKHMASFDVTFMEDVGHFLMLEKPQQFNDELRTIIDKIEDQL